MDMTNADVKQALKTEIVYQFSLLVYILSSLTSLMFLSLYLFSHITHNSLSRIRLMHELSYDGIRKAGNRFMGTVSPYLSSF